MADASPDLRQIVLEALKDSTQGRPLLGSALGNLAARVAAAEGFVFKDELRRSGLTLKRLLEQMPDAVKMRPAPVGPDFVVTTSDGPLQEIAKTPVARQLRKDVYDAFTRLRDEPIYYDPVRDRFLRDRSTESDILVPPITIDALIGDRRTFVSGLENPDLSAALTRSLENPPSALAEFKLAVERAGLEQAWHSAVADSVHKRIEAWATQNGLTFRDEWLRYEPRSYARDPRQTLIQVAQYMTDHEVRALQLPLHAVEALIVMRGLRS